MRFRVTNQKYAVCLQPTWGVCGGPGGGGSSGFANLFYSQDRVVATLPRKGVHASAVQHDILVLVHTTSRQANGCMPPVAFCPLQLWAVHHYPGTCCSHHTLTGTALSSTETVREGEGEGLRGGPLQRKGRGIQRGEGEVGSVLQRAV